MGSPSGSTSGVGDSAMVALSSISDLTGIDFGGFAPSSGVATTGSPGFGRAGLGSGSVFGGPIGELAGKAIGSALGSPGGFS